MFEYLKTGRDHMLTIPYLLSTDSCLTVSVDSCKTSAAEPRNRQSVCLGNVCVAYSVKPFETETKLT
jgi:hypothetical protein